MHVLAFNCGSSSIKAALIESGEKALVLEGRFEGVGAPAGELRVGNDSHAVSAPDHADALESLVREMRSAVGASARIEAVAHRIVHGGARFVSATLVDDEAVEELARLSDLAPLHNPPAVAALRRARSALPHVPHVAVFDTAFHARLPDYAREYALPRSIRQDYGMRRYGFHGISHEHVMRTVAEHFCTEASALRIVSCHLGAGASVAAIEHGRCIDTSMGMTPLEGLVMATRAGDIDAGAILQLLRAGMSVDELEDVLNRRSGLAGITGTNDMRTIQLRAAEGDAVCALAIAMYAYRVRKYIGAYAAAMGGVDVIAFTAGVGENSVVIRKRCMERLEFLDARLSEDRNHRVRLTAAAPLADISNESSRTRLLVVRADEERAMVREAASLLSH